MTDRTVPPVSGPIRPYEFPPVSRKRLENGLEVCVVPTTSLPIVTAMVVLPGGETAVPAQQAGLAVLSGDALEGGTERLTSRELAGALEGVGASFGAATGWDSTTVAVACQADVLADAMPLLAQMVHSPTFEKSEFDRYRAQRLASAARRRMNPSAIAADAHARHVFSQGDTYRAPPAAPRPPPRAPPVAPRPRGARPPRLLRGRHLQPPAGRDRGLRGDVGGK